MLLWVSFVEVGNLQGILNQTLYSIQCVDFSHAVINVLEYLVSVNMLSYQFRPYNVGGLWGKLGNTWLLGVFQQETLNQCFLLTHYPMRQNQLLFLKALNRMSFCITLQCKHICIYPTSSHEQDAKQSQFVKRLNEVKESSLTYYLPIAEERIDKFIHFQGI